ncbi:hypothetical protein [Desulfurobacterium sp. TC5-1]|uniref:hypothetical protein n=1 Tax=Desulfurobacterium sp. TC5-1 TaxID=1158318 RepID=UPI0003B3A4ED|nr:hypothetical protein [Desulfurobacterium sp. TC5-1]
MIEIAIICDNCGKKKAIETGAARTLSFHPLNLCPRNWKITYSGEDYTFLCPNCSKRRKDESKNNSNY